MARYTVRGWAAKCDFWESVSKRSSTCRRPPSIRSISEVSSSIRAKMASSRLR